MNALETGRDLQISATGFDTHGIAGFCKCAPMALSGGSKKEEEKR